MRRAFLCGKDAHTGFDFEHRRQWIVDRIKLLCSIFAVDLCAYAVKQWTDEEVASRWMQIFNGPLLMHQYLGKADQPVFGAVGLVTLLRAFAKSVGRSFIKGQALGNDLFPEKT